MKGAPMHDTSSKHGTNANYKKSGAPGLLGKILDPLGLKNKLMGGKDCPPAAGARPAAVPGAAPAQPAGPAPSTPAPATASVAEEASPATMKASPAKGKVWDAVKRGGEAIYDKASQVGMGLKGMTGRNFTDEMYNAKKAFSKEKNADIAMRKKEEASRKKAAKRKSQGRAYKKQ